MNGRMVDKDRIIDGLCEIADYIYHKRHNAAVTQVKYLSKEREMYYQEVIESAKDYLSED
tara:strand:+ start:276 stop:455 length:180 start_codon:yes stop_codon:yes gene_type:complete